MATGDVRITLDTKVLDRIIRNTDNIRRDTIETTARTVEDIAKKNVQGNAAGGLKAVDTGSLVNSIYVTFSWQSQSIPDLKDKVRSPKTGRIVNIGERRAEIPRPPASSSQDVARIGPSVDYGIYVELGTTRMSARPYMRNSIEKVEDDMRRQLRRLERGK